MNRAFEVPQRGATPRVQLNKLLTHLDTAEEQSLADEQEGYRHIFIGVSVGIRNVRAHSLDVGDNIPECLDLITLISHLLRKLDNCVDLDDA